VAAMAPSANKAIPKNLATDLRFIGSPT
jgi:hypothetical protein